MPDLERTILDPYTAPNHLGAYSQSLKVSPAKLLLVAGQVA